MLRQEGVSADAAPPSPTKEDNESSDPDPATTTSDSQNKRRRGQRGRNQYPKWQFTVNAISAVGEPIDPPEIVAKFHNAIRAIIRTKVFVDPTIPKWTLVPEGRKETMWQLLSRTFILPRGTRDKVKHSLQQEGLLTTGYVVVKSAVVVVKSY